MTEIKGKRGRGRPKGSKNKKIGDILHKEVVRPDLIVASDSSSGLLPEKLPDDIIGNLLKVDDLETDYKSEPSLPRIGKFYVIKIREPDNRSRILISHMDFNDSFPLTTRRIMTPLGLANGLACPVVMRFVDVITDPETEEPIGVYHVISTPSMVRTGVDPRRVAESLTKGEVDEQLSEYTRHKALCFDDKTEILTDNGWKLFKYLDRTEKVLTLDKDTEEIEWQSPSEYVDESYKGSMLSLDNRIFNIMATPNHRLLAKRLYKNNWELVAMEDMNPRGWKMLRTYPNWKGKGMDIIKIPIPKTTTTKLKNFKESFKADDFFEFLGWYLSEGSKGTMSVEISQDKEKNPENYKEIVKCFNKLGFEPSVRDDRVVLYSKQLYEYCKQFGKCNEKFVPDYIKNASKRQIDIFLTALFKGDGTFLNGKYQNYSTTSKQLADDVQELLHKLGLGCVIKRYDDRKSNWEQNYPIYQLSTSYKMISPQSTEPFESVEYDGRIYCVKVPNETIFVRRNGKCIWSGNSYKMQRDLWRRDAETYKEQYNELSSKRMEISEEIAATSIEMLVNAIMASKEMFDDIRKKNMPWHQRYQSEILIGVGIIAFLWLLSSGALGG